jgi:putative peptidoglycan lipid II flippase
MEGEQSFGAGRARTPSLALAAAIVAAGFLGSRLLGLLRSVVIADGFGTGGELDAYWVAFRLPDLVFQLLAGATLASAFIPTFARVDARDGAAAGWRLASSVLNLVFVATLVFAVVGFLLAPLIVPLLAPGLGEATGQQSELQDLAVELTRIMLLSPILFAVSGMFMGILNARHRFLTPALAPMLYNGAIIVAALLSDDIYVLAWSVVAGAALHLAVQLPELWRAGMAYSPIARWRDADVRRVGILMAPRVLGLAAFQINFLVLIIFASTLQDGAISAANFAWLLLMAPVGLIGIAISTAVFPTLAGQAARSEERQLSTTLRRSLGIIVYLSLPVSVALLLLAKPVVVLLLQRGAFDVASSDLTAQALTFYAIGLLGHTTIEIFSRGFYALSDTRTPVALAVASMLLNVVLAAVLVGPLDVRGLALALSIASLVEAALLFFVLRRRLVSFDTAAVLRSVAWIGIAAAFMAVTTGVLRVLLEADETTTSGAFVILLVAGGGGAIAYLAASYALGLDELRQLLARLRPANRDGG